MTEKKTRCFNCKSSDCARPVFCDDCWRMLIIANVSGGVLGKFFDSLGLF